jgi:hypothetical protein
MTRTHVDIGIGPPLDQYQRPTTQPVDEDERVCPVAILWVPDPEQASGWREFYVHPQKPAGKRRSFGYGGKEKPK